MTRGSGNGSGSGSGGGGGNGNARGRVAVWVAGAVCAVIPLALHVVGGYFVLGALLTESEGPWDRSVTDTVRTWGALAVVTELLAAAATAAFVGTRRLRRWWFGVPAVLILAAVVRMVFAPVP
ncbi:hypothetical protein OHA98_36745 [Streptomyces sp. NBC_00654]|uniref:hypothetical protein n=1 Tax=Streptomyces sp. NBC_00654 TaxID=2975799 RepID=UPI0022509647|nr:hypothetical protein [Streptomyces sp. NBC_00654]MCX4970212.1 hypothetical protein [Streptomyces sp. NBC_00654]